MERCVTGQEKVYKAVQSLYEATLKAKQAMINLGVDVVGSRLEANVNMEIM